MCYHCFNYNTVLIKICNFLITQRWNSHSNLTIVYFRGRLAETYCIGKLSSNRENVSKKYSIKGIIDEAQAPSDRDPVFLSKIRHTRYVSITVWIQCQYKMTEVWLLWWSWWHATRVSRSGLIAVYYSKMEARVVFRNSRLEYPTIRAHTFLRKDQFLQIQLPQNVLATSHRDVTTKWFRRNRNRVSCNYRLSRLPRESSVHGNFLV